MVLILNGAILLAELVKGVLCLSLDKIVIEICGGYS